MERTTYRLYKLTERDGYVEFAHTTSAALAALILRMCERQATPSALYEVRPALPVGTVDTPAVRTLTGEPLITT